MLSAGSRIGSNRILKWIREGACGQSYQSEQTEGEGKGKKRFIKLILREISERPGFEDFFIQECQAIEQLQGRGIWPLLKFGTMKWKHWVSFDWLEGEEGKVESSSDREESEVVEKVRTLEDWMHKYPDIIGPDQLFSIIVDMHCGLDRAHRSGVVHGNIKPSNVLVASEKENFKGWVSEFGLAKIVSYRPLGMDDDETISYTSQNSQSQDSLHATANFRPDDVHWTDQPEEKWDLQGLGKIVLWVIERSQLSPESWVKWKKWAELSVSLHFPDIAHSMKEIPGITDLAEYGMKLTDADATEGDNLDEIRAKRELAWKLEQKHNNLNFKRNMTGLIGALCLFAFTAGKIYLFFNPSPWTEFYLDGALDKYQLGAGVWSGQAWGIVPANYDDDGDGGQDVVGTWEKEDGLLKLNFRKFKKINDEEDGKKLWQFIGSGATSPSDYHYWTDYLDYDPVAQSLRFVKRVDADATYIAGLKKGENPRLYPEVRLRRSSGNIKPAELFFRSLDGESTNWAVFFGVGFLLACFIYQRELNKLPSPD